MTLENTQQDFDQQRLDSALPGRIRARMERTLPGRDAQRQFAHELSYGRHFWLNAYPSIPAATAIVLMRRDNEWQIPLTLRPDTLASHAGQICLPGGRVDSGESLPAAAVREVNEELHLPAASLEVIGPLSPLYLYASNFHVTPFVTVCSLGPDAIVPNSDEVAELIWLKVGDLLAPDRRGKALRTSGAGPTVEFAAPYFALPTGSMLSAEPGDTSTSSDTPIAANRHQVWGATAMMLSEFAAIL